MDFDVSNLIAGAVFGLFGMFLIRLAKMRGHLPSLVIGIGLIVFPYFVSNAYLLWGIGSGLLFVAYRLARN